jgi:Arc/MetJ-type ribon-helix-helix transcriptional regulator
MAKVKISITLDPEVVKYLDSVANEKYRGSRSFFINQLLIEHKEQEVEEKTAFNEILSRLEVLEKWKEQHEALSHPTPLPKVEPKVEISEILPEEVPKAVREWVEYRLEEKGYIRWKEDRDSWIAIGEVGNSASTFQRYMKKCGLQYSGAPEFKWTRE